jgi:putative ABC transport system permease protein
MTLTLAIRNLIHDRVRLVVTLTGVAFAVVLITTELGLFLGFAATTSALIDRSQADIWIVPKGTRNVDQTPPMSERRRYQALSTAGVASAELFVTEFVRWQKPDGGVETVLVVGFEPDGTLAGPWNVVAGNVADLKRPGTIFVDELYADKLAVSALGQIIEVHGKRARVIGLTSGIRSFTQSPYVFASLKSSRDYAQMRSDQTKHVLVKLVRGANVEMVKADLAARLQGVDVYTKDEFSARTRFYWMFTTGAGLALLVASFVGLIVGFVVVAQTLYATTVDHIREFGTLRAIGAGRRYINGVVVKQALMSAIAGYTIGMALFLFARYVAGSAAPEIALPWLLALLIAMLTVAMCVGAALVCIRKVMKLDPAMVFK